MTPHKKFLEKVVKKPAPLLSIILLCRLSEDEISTKYLVTRLISRQKVAELIVVVEPSSFPTASQFEFISWCSQQGCQVIVPDSPCGLAAIRINEGILASHGRWIWLVDANNKIPAFDSGGILSLLAGLAENVVPILIHPDQQEQFLVIPGVRLLWLDMLYKGWQFPFENIFFPRDVFERLGLLDPHIVMGSFYQQEFLLRICRFVQFEKIDDTRAVDIRAGRFPAIFYYWLDIDRRQLLHPSRIWDYAIDDLEQFRRGMPETERWQAYLDYVLPYYYRYRHFLPDGLLDRPQSLATRFRHILCVKSDHYATTTDVTIRNFDVWAQGGRFYKLSYIFAGQIETDRLAQNDAILLLRTVEKGTLDLAVKRIREGVPIGYALDDDLINISENGGEMAPFKAGHPAYDAMVDTLRLADVVICGGKHVESVVQQINRRTVQFDASILPEFLPESPVKGKKGTPFKFGYAGGSYRVGEMRMLWPAIERIRREYRKRVSFEFWGLDPKQVSDNLEGISFVPFSINYYEYLSRLKSAGFQAMLIPLLSQPAHRRGKLPVKLWETAAIGAVGLYSDVPAYQVVKTNKLGLMIEESAEAWYEAMCRVLDMPETEYADLQARSVAFVREFYTTPAMIPVHEHGLEAILFHGATRDKRGPDGRPYVLYVLPAKSLAWSREPQFRRLIDLAQRSAISPLVVIPDGVKGVPEWTSFRDYLEEQKIAYQFAPYVADRAASTSEEAFHGEMDENRIRALLTRYPVAFVHSLGLHPTLSRLCAELHIPHVAHLPSGRLAHQEPDNPFPYKLCDLIESGSIHDAKRWGQQLGRPWFCFHEVEAEFLYEIGFDRLYGGETSPGTGGPLRLGTIGSVVPENHQREVIKAVARLVEQGHCIQLQIFDDASSDPAYYADCLKMTGELRMHDRIFFRGAIQDLREVYPNLDILVNVSTQDRSTVMNEAMASGVLVVCAPQGGTAELLNDHVNGILVCSPESHHLMEALSWAITLPAAESLRIRRNAYRLARQVFHPRRGSADLLAMYNLVLKNHGTVSESQIESPRVTIAREPQIDSPPLSPRSHLPVGCGLTYRVVPKRMNWIGLDLLVGTHQRPASGALRLRVLSEAEQLVREASVNLSLVSDNDWVKFRFDPIANADSQPFMLEFKIVDGGLQTCISLYEDNPPGKFLRRLLRRTGLFRSGDSLHCRMWYGGKG